MRKTATVLLVMAAAILVFAAVNLYGQVFGVHEPGSTYFPDVTVGTPGDEHIGWLAESEVTGGFPDGTYRPDDYVTREQMAIYLARQRAVSMLDAMMWADFTTGGYFYFSGAWDWGHITLEQYHENEAQMMHGLKQAASIGLDGELTLPHASQGWWEQLAQWQPSP